MKKYKRCFFYDSRGRIRKPRYEGAHVPESCNCHKYAHPGDYEWNKLPPSFAPSFLAKTPSRSPSPIPLTPMVPSPVSPLVTDIWMREREMVTPVSAEEGDQHALLAKLINLQTTYRSLSEQYMNLQQMISTGRSFSTERLISQRNASGKQLKLVHAQMRDLEQNLLHQLHSDPTLEDKLTLLQNLHDELRRKLCEANDLEKEVGGAKLATASIRAIVKHEVDGDIIMDVPSSSHNQKRLTGPTDLTVLEKYISRLQIALGKVTQQVVTVEEDVNVQENELLESMRPALVRRRASVIDVATNEADYLYNELSQVAQWRADMIEENNVLDAKHQKLIKNTQKQEAELQKLMGRVEILQKEEQKEDKEIENLQASLTAYLGRPGLSEAPFPFDPEETAMDLEKQISERVRNIIRPHIDDVRSELISTIVQQDFDLYNTLVPKITTTYKVTDIISHATAA
ncbi:hypothetical protein BDP27DRAFT_1325058 [Rhodocollybia butyracea]|uniref:Uncharacterized protein n=1 Tax=Rhodocollybia butyracea TaxID=206335 RepID=A0A9P5PWZ5_9AGAR|nr:hypothetical protein BDP27DRAFT_1325058 [Rhodocollybia butyracea]